MRTYPVKRIPKEIKRWIDLYKSNHLDSEYTFEVYKYGEVYYGINMFRNGKFFDNSHQGTLENFAVSASYTQ